MLQGNGNQFRMSLNRNFKLGKIQMQNPGQTWQNNFTNMGGTQYQQPIAPPLGCFGPSTRNGTAGFGNGDMIVQRQVL